MEVKGRRNFVSFLSPSRQTLGHTSNYETITSQLKIIIQWHTPSVADSVSLNKLWNNKLMKTMIQWSEKHISEPLLLYCYLYVQHSPFFQRIMSKNVHFWIPVHHRWSMSLASTCRAAQQCGMEWSRNITCCWWGTEHTTINIH